MTRIGDIGGYEVGNVEIKTNGHNFSESFLKTSASARRKKAISRGGYAKKTHCKKGHEYTADNTYIYGGNRVCKSCHKINCAAHYKSKKTKQARKDVEVGA